MNRYLAGAIGGLLATIPMTLVMERLHRRLPSESRYPLPPREVTENMAGKLGHDPHPDEDRLIGSSLLAHFAYGAATGALYPLVFRGPVRHPAVYGSGYGVAIWAASYLGWVPAFNVLEPATRQPWNRRRLMLCAHAVWGAGTLLVAERLAHPDDAPWRGEAPPGGWHRP
ncbi:DUF1440 domain-containing protein [Halomonas sp. McH1-25]|uniref:DUF1440 domain-containing protein n=1 Tax=unclassified Halomonas TaxID=2609666 RepID=UPI001EF51DF3|nr:MULTISPECIES: DUF1440 domain-containing protein [unclassified Halomonas]MCG7600196.1 DUF1440 domain-containing protein [Halomonas sp. McH1-25]MCP1341445.1 DUF1440 domain-containing protein [Halomonas sp. FL8]MCP1360522.1 DUF1440 domain-containing protein [Halomonas sp. BBD45]MCP1364037.1 DUF1440 domain-containing protein [Halomonas sp. BBD48]